ncbi:MULTISPECIES: GGDEF domain-containing protein [unclassified Streptomyces]|uniref:GGDEF domain-containing protein n=1 Tax=unclassified Streptomyces TaxID=2593676 RepID=UPI0033B214A8
MAASTAIRASVDSLPALAAAYAAINAGTPSATVLEQLAQVTETLLAQVNTLTEQLNEARTCPVTQLPTRAAWNALAAQVCTTGTTAVLLIDLNGFKAVNDTHGHAAGDAVLAATGERLKNWAEEFGYAGRLGGDEFAVVMRQENPMDMALSIMNLRARLCEPVVHDGVNLSVGAALGAATVRGRTTEALSEAMGRADRRMYRDKGRYGRR